MIHWIIQNKERLFSGTRVLAIGLISKITFYFRGGAELFRSANNPSQRFDSDSPKWTHSTKIVKLENILKELRKIPPLQLQERTGQYLGIRVRGFGRLNSLDKLEEGLVGITLYPKNSVGIIRTVFHPDQYPKIGSVEHGAEVEIEGRITDIENRYGIYLSEPKLKF